MKFKDLIKNKKISSVLLAFIVLIGVFSAFNICFAEKTTNFLGAGNLMEGALLKMLASIAFVIVWISGQIISVVIGAILSIVSYNNFIHEPTIVDAWIIVRDLCNMFFVLILLVIAFATILKIENYNVKKLLPKLLIMAVLINFSKTICGLLIDFSQVILLTFTNAFSDSGGNFMAYTQTQKFLSITTDFSGEWWSSADLNATNVLGGIFLAIIFMVVSAIAFLAILIVFLMRMIMLWVYIVLSPLAFLLSSFPVGQKYAAQYWGEFTKYLVNGPVLAFFIWLSLMTVQNFKADELKMVKMECTTEIMCLPNFITFIIAIGFLVGGLIVSQQIGGMGASWGASAVSGLKTRGLGLAQGAAFLPVKGAGKLAKNIGGWGVDKLSGVAGVDLNVVRGYKRLTAQMDKHKAERALSVRDKTLETAEKGGRIRGGLAHLSTGDLAWRSATNWYKEGLKPVRRAIMGGKWAVQEDNIKQLKDERKETWSSDELDKHEQKIYKTDGNIKKKEEELSKLSPGVLGSPEHKEYSKVSSELNAFEDEAKSLKERRDDMKGKVDDKKAKKTDLDIKKYTDRMEKYTIPGLTEARVLTQAEMEGEQGKIVAHIDNSQELGRILAEAIKNKQQGLVSAVAKKMTRVGDYNEAMKALKLGTGRDGMLGFAEILREQGGFTQQASLGLVGEMGNIAKNIKHFGAYGAVKMEHGKWTEASEDQYEAAKYAEMGKVQKQSFARDTNRLGLGHYEGPIHDEEHWVLDKSTIALFKDPSYAKHYDKTEGTANLSAIGHLARHADRLEKNGATAIAAKVEGREDEVEVDPMAAVRGVKK